jgi:hypothetical protein
VSAPRTFSLPRILSWIRKQFTRRQKSRLPRAVISYKVINTLGYTIEIAERVRKQVLQHLSTHAASTHAKLHVPVASIFALPLSWTERPIPKSQHNLRVAKLKLTTITVQQ